MFLSKAHLTLLVSSVLLASCGGGGGGGDSVTKFEFDGNTPPINERWGEVESTGIKFGSVYGAGSVGFGTVSNVKTNFDGEHTSLTVERSNGDSLVFNRSSHLEEYDLEKDGYWDGYSHELKDYLKIAVYSDYGTVSGLTIGTHYNVNDPTDYIAYGYWIDVGINANGLSALEIGAFADGSEFGINSEVTSKIGKATYYGDAVLGFMGEDYSDFISGGYIGTLQLTADFSDATGNGIISGNIGKDYGYMDTTFVDKISAAQITTSLQPEFYLRLNETDISNGRFIGNNVDVIENGRIFNSEGEYGGQFSDIPDFNGQPDAVIGVITTSWEDSNGYVNGVWGSFIGASVDEND